MLGSDDNRDFMRMTVDADAKVILGYDEGGAHEKIYDAKCLDLSAAGVSLKLAHDISEGTELAVYIKSGSQLPGLKALAEVVRSQRLEDGDYQLGCRITKML